MRHNKHCDRVDKVNVRTYKFCCYHFLWIQTLNNWRSHLSRIKKKSIFFNWRGVYLMSKWGIGIHFCSAMRRFYFFDNINWLFSLSKLTPLLMYSTRERRICVSYKRNSSIIKLSMSKKKALLIISFLFLNFLVLVAEFRRKMSSEWCVVDTLQATAVSSKKKKKDAKNR
jgi:hypothetical protein